jgi:hypothetical protein
VINELGERLALIIDARTDGAVSNIRRLSVEEKAAADRADLLKAKLADLEARAAKQSTRPGGVSAVTARQLNQTKSELAGLESTLATVPAGAGTAERALAKLGLQGTVTGAALSKGLAGGAAGLAVFGGFEFLKSGVENFTHLADEIRAVQQASSSSAEDSSKLVAITTALGVSSDVAALGVFRLGKNIDLTPQKLGAYGIAVAHTKDGNTDLIGTLANVAAAYQKTTDPARRAAIVYEAFGRAGTTMLPILNANADKLREIASEAGKQGRIFSAQDLANAKEYEITMRELSDSFQALGIAAGRTLVPALSKVAGLLTDVSDAAHSAPVRTLGSDLAHIAAGPLNFLPSRLNPFAGGGSGGSPAQKAAAELQARQDQATQDALEKAAQATLGNASDLLATPGQGLVDAKQTLKDARQALTDAVNARNKAAKDLATVRAGAPGADATALEAAAARVHAAKAKLRAAQYVGGDARVSGAQATLLSAQNSLNKLREQGGTSTTKLAAATERLHKANEAVASARSKEQAAQKARNQATGFSATDIQNQLTAQLKDRTKLATAQNTIHNLGATPELLAFLDQANQKQAGTLVKYAHTATAAMVRSMNDTLAQSATQEGIYDAVAGALPVWETAGQQRGDAFSKGFAATVSIDGFVGGSSPSPAYRKGRTQAYAGDHSAPIQQNFNGPITVHAPDPAALGRKLAAKRRLAALSGRTRLT